MTAPERATADGYGYRFHIRRAMPPVSTLLLGLVGLVGGMVFLAASFLAVALLAAAAFEWLAWSADHRVLGDLVSALFLLPLYGPPVVLLLTLGWWTRGNDHHLIVEGPRVRLMRRGRAIWSGSVDDVHLTPAHPHWEIRVGPRAFRIINPAQELTWLQKDVEQRRLGTGDRADVPTHLAGIRRHESA